MAAFLSVNGFVLQFDDIEAYQFMIALYETVTFRKAELDLWLRVRTRLR